MNGCFVAEPLRELQALGAANSVIGVEPIYRPKRTASREFPAEWIRYPQIPGNLGLSSSGSFLGGLLLNRVKELHRRFPVNVIHAHAALPAGDAAAYLSRRLGIPFAVTIHGLDVFNSCFRQGIAAGWRRNASLKVYKKALKVICISEKVRRLVTDAMSSEVATEVIHNGVDPGSVSVRPCKRRDARNSGCRKLCCRSKVMNSCCEPWSN